MFGCCKKQVDAKIVDDALVVSFTATDVPKLWRTELRRIAGASLEIRLESGKHHLIVKSGDTTEAIAVFNDKKSAADALSAITAELMKGGKRNQSGFFKFLFKWFIRLTLLAIALFLLAILLTPGQTGNGFSSDAPIGIPMPADQMLGGAS